MVSKIKILMVEDLPTDAELIIREIKKSGIEFDPFIVETKDAYIKALHEFNPDIILSDYCLPTFDGMNALILRKEFAPHIPFILVTGSINEETAVEVMKAGADDYVIKEHLTRIGSAIKTAMEKKDIIRLKKEAEEKLAWEQYLFKTLIENIPDCIYFKDLESRFVRINKALADLFKLEDPLIALGKSDSDFFKSEHSLEALYDEQEIIKTGIPVIGKEEMEMWPDRPPTWVSTTKMPLKDSKGNIIGTFGISRDITARKIGEEELRKAKEKAEENDSLKTAFLQNISHEIRTPMNAIVGFSEFLGKPDLTPEKRKHFTDIVIESANHLLSIISDIVSIATIEAGQEELNEKEINVNSLCRLLYEQFYATAQRQKIILRLRTSLANDNADIVVDDTKLVQILSNLIGNALKFTKQGYIEFGYRVKENNLEFYTEDTGIGIAEEMHEEIFKRFRQVDYSATRKFGGSGLGLSISRAYVELLGGKIWLTSSPGKGSVFYFTIPAKKTRSFDGNVAIASDFYSDFAGNKKAILIAEDEYSNFMILEEYLSGMGLKILRATNGSEAIEICKTTPVDLILMDIKMPVMNGYEATKKIKELAPEIPIIAQTAYSLPMEKELALLAGCDDIIIKPLKESELKEMVTKYLFKI